MGCMKSLLLALFVALLMVGCGEADLSDPEVLKDVTADAVDWSKLQDRSGVTYLQNTEEPYSGYAKRAYEDGQHEILAQFKDGYVVRFKQWEKNGTPRWDIGYMEGKVGIEGMPYKKVPRDIKENGHGRATRWYENGQKSKEVNFKDGKLDGLATRWHDNGQKEGEGNYKDGKKHGLYIEWYENGQKREEGNYKEGNQDGLWTDWYENGQKWKEGTYKDGKEDGLWTKWYENGQKWAELNYRDGKLMETVQWKFNGEKCPGTNVKNGNGILVWYNGDGSEWSHHTYKDGERVD